MNSHKKSREKNYDIYFKKSNNMVLNMILIISQKIDENTS